MSPKLLTHTLNPNNHKGDDWGCLKCNSMAIFTLNLYHDGVFVPNPLKYMKGGFKVVNDIQFEDMRIVDLFKVVTRLNCILSVMIMMLWDTLIMRGGTSINDVFKTQKEVGESSKRGGGTESKRGRGCARGSGTMGSRTTSNRSRGCARGFGTMGRGTARKRGRGCARGSGTIGRGSGTMGRGSARGSATVGRGSTRGGHVGSTAMGSRSKRGGTARKGFDDSNNTEVMDEEERLHAEKEQRLDSERGHNGRIYQDWDQVSQVSSSKDLHLVY
ncbi:hypothetical protein Tco_1554781 [Tanacetum coccineum]